MGADRPTPTALHVAAALKKEVRANWCLFLVFIASIGRQWSPTIAVQSAVRCTNVRPAAVRRRVARAWRDFACLGATSGVIKPHKIGFILSNDRRIVPCVQARLISFVFLAMAPVQHSHDHRVLEFLKEHVGTRIWVLDSPDHLRVLRVRQPSLCPCGDAGLNVSRNRSTGPATMVTVTFRMSP